MIGPAEFEITQVTDGTALTLVLRGELDMRTARLLTEELTAHVRSETTALTLDLRDLSFMDSSGVRLLIELDERARTEGWELRLVAPEHEAAALVLRVTGADTALPFSDGGER